MIEFKKDVGPLLPYDRKSYIEFLEADSSIKWYGVSIQLPGVFEGRDIGLTKFVEVYEPLFKNAVLKLDNGSVWVVNHHDKDLKWFPRDRDNLTHLRNLFKQRGISSAFVGALTFDKNDLLEFSKDLISYPYSAAGKEGFLYKNLDISHGELQFIIKVSAHLTIDFLSTNIELLKKMLDQNSSNVFILREYTGTSLKK